jgi:putative acetyltransferase
MPSDVRRCAKVVAMKDEVSALQVRRAVPADADRMAEIQATAVRACATGFYPAPVIEAWAWGPEKREACRGWIGESGIEVRICGERERPVAFAVFVANLDAVYVHSLYCDPQRIRRGVGRLLMADIRQFAQAREKRRLTVQSSLNALGFYGALGFARLGDGFQEIGPAKLRWDYVAMAKPLVA